MWAQAGQTVRPVGSEPPLSSAFQSQLQLDPTSTPTLRTKGWGNLRHGLVPSTVGIIPDIYSPERKWAQSDRETHGPLVRDHRGAEGAQLPRLLRRTSSCREFADCSWTWLCFYMKMEAARPSDAMSRSAYTSLVGFEILCVHHYPQLFLDWLLVICVSMCVHTGASHTVHELRPDAKVSSKLRTLAKFLVSALPFCLEKPVCPGPWGQGLPPQPPHHHSPL